MEESGLSNVIGRILRDIAVELGDEFDKNFEREGFSQSAGSAARAQWARAAC